MPLNPDLLGARPLVNALLNPATAPRVTIEARHAGAPVWSGHVAQVSQTGSILRVRAHAENLSPSVSVDGVFIEFGALSLAAGVAPSDVSVTSAAPLPGSIIEFLFSTDAPASSVVTVGGYRSVEDRLKAIELAAAGHVTSAALAAESTARFAAIGAESSARQAEYTALGVRIATLESAPPATKSLSVEPGQGLTYAEGNAALQNIWDSGGYSFSVSTQEGGISFSNPMYSAYFSAMSGVGLGYNNQYFSSLNYNGLWIQDLFAVSVWLSTDGFRLAQSGADVHSISLSRLAFFGGIGVSAPRPAASTVTLEDVIALLAELGLVR